MQARALLVAILSVFGAMCAIQFGASFAKQLFPLVGPIGTTALRVGFSALILWLVFRPWRQWPRARHWRAITVYGGCLGGMMMLLYLSIETIPLGIAVALEFTGPLLVALISIRRARDSLWIVLAVGGVITLLPDLSGVDALDPRGVAYALAAGGCWAGYILFGQKAGNLAPGGGTVALGMSVAALYLVPVGYIATDGAIFQWQLIPLGVAVALISSAIPYSLEMIALRNMPKQTFSVMMSLEPAVAAMAGLLVLDEQLALRQWLAIGMVISASLGSTLSAKRR
jgi:Predicted permease, DMT superfamily